ncbi:MAG TPA: CrcB family protein [Anaeromyxobacteraceae bacterium]|nr:CrcB family protein [Anaeromyxobacteraceae bacterium]
MKELLLVCLGGAIGSGARYLVALWAARVTVSIPLGTFTVNVVGSFLLGVVMTASLRGALSPVARVALAAGVMGGFTTYSSFNWEMLASLERGAWLVAALYGGVTLVSCLVAGAAGAALTRAVVP